MQVAERFLVGNVKSDYDAIDLLELHESLETVPLLAGRIPHLNFHFLVVALWLICLQLMSNT